MNSGICGCAMACTSSATPDAARGDSVWLAVIAAIANLGRHRETLRSRYGHFTTRQNIQYNWPKLEDVPDILADLAAVEMHAIQTSGNCIRNTTSDHLAGCDAQ